MGVTPGRTLHIHALSFRGVSGSDLSVEGGGVARDVAALGQSIEPCRRTGQPRPEVGPARFGLATFRLSAGRSNQAKLRARGRGVDPGPTYTFPQDGASFLAAT